jgi:uncharacterized membrane protein
MSGLLRILTLFWTGLMAGYFWSMHHTIMPGLAQIDPSAAMLAMQSMSQIGDSAMFGIVFFGATLLHLAVVIDCVVHWRGVAPKIIFVASSLFLVGVALTTMAAQGPLADMIAMIDADSPTFASDWADFANPWSTWNDLRAGASIGSFLLLSLTFTSS